MKVSLVFVTLFVFALMVFPCRLTQGRMVDEMQECKALVRLIDTEDSTEWEKAESLYANVPEDSKFKIVAAQAYAFVLVRQERYSEAWKLLATQTANLKSASASIKLGHERLKLWLLMESNSAKTSEAQFQRLATIAVAKNLGNNERKDVCAFLGEAMGMIECAGEESCVALEIAKQAVAPLMEIESKSSLVEYQDKKEAANSWGSDFQRVWSEIKEANGNPTDSLKTLRSELDSLTSKVADLKMTVDENGKTKKRLEAERRKLLMELAAIESQWDNVLPNRPLPPVEPPRPRSPETFYRQRDAKTGLQEIDREKTENDRQRYNNEMNTYRQRLTQYQDDLRQFPMRLKDWEQREADRRNKLKQDKVAKQVEIESKVKEMKDQSDAAAVDYEQHQQALSELKATESRWFVTDRVVKQLNVESNASKTLFRPSNFRFFDFEHEQTRLEISLKN